MADWWDGPMSIHQTTDLCQGLSLPRHILQSLSIRQADALHRLMKLTITAFESLETHHLIRLTGYSYMNRIKIHWSLILYIISNWMMLNCVTPHTWYLNVPVLEKTTEFAFTSIQSWLCIQMGSGWGETRWTSGFVSTEVLLLRLTAPTMHI